MDSYYKEEEEDSKMNLATQFPNNNNNSSSNSKIKFNNISANYESIDILNGDSKSMIPHSKSFVDELPNNNNLGGNSRILRHSQSISIDSSKKEAELFISPNQTNLIKLSRTHHSPSIVYASPKLLQLYNGLINSLPEELIMHVLLFLKVSDLFNTFFVCKKWKRLSEDEDLFRRVCYRNYPILTRCHRPPFETTWRRYYNLRKQSFLVLGGPITQSACMDDICNKLRAQGIGTVDSYFTQKQLPTLEELQKYTAVLVYCYNSSAFLDGILMGDLLADYVDNGGGVVVTVFTNCINLKTGFIQGRFLDQNYHPIRPALQRDTNGKKPLQLGRVMVSDHPIMKNIKALDGGKSSFYCHGKMNPEAELVAEWNNGVPLVSDLKKSNGRVVALNFFPPSSDTGDHRFWNSSTDGSQLMVNSLLYVGKCTSSKPLPAPSTNDQLRLKDGEGASELSRCSSSSSLNSKKKKNKFFSKRIPLFFKLFTTKKVSQ